MRRTDRHGSRPARKKDGARTAKRPERNGRRVKPEERRRQLLAVAAHLLTTGGVEQVHITEVAERAGVSRPLVYRLFPTRQALVGALLDDLGAELSRRFQEAVIRVMPGTIDAIAAAFVEACCDVVEDRGAGPWRLLVGSGGDPELARIGRAALRRVLEPWQVRLGELTGRNARKSASLMWTIVAAGRAALDGWVDGELSRRDAVADATRTVTALVKAFAVAPLEATEARGRR